jgi:hypothetical protein
VWRLAQAKDDDDFTGAALRKETAARECFTERRWPARREGECEAEAAALGKERDGAAVTYRRRWRRSRTGAVGRRWLRTARSGAGA